MKQELILQNLFSYLVEKGFPLGVRDYRDALEALRRGYGLHRRQDLLWLCQTLWARTDEEKRFIDTLFKQFSFRPDEKTKELLKQGESLTGSEPLPETPFTPPDKKIRTEGEEKPAPQIDFTPAGNREGGIGLTRVRAEAASSEYFILTPRLIISLRRLTIIWRRFRAVKREGPKVELDLEATIKEKCRQGILSEPVLIPARRNQARIVVLVDVSDSMTPWQDFNKTLLSSLQRGKLGESKVFYFHNTPDEVLYEKETLIKPNRIAEALKEYRNSTLLILSDGGAARGFRSRMRIAETKQFLDDISKFWHPVVWLNPMPPARWKGTTAEAVERLLKGNMFQLNEEGLIKAIDVLRGTRRSN